MFIFNGIGFYFGKFVATILPEMFLSYLCRFCQPTIDITGFRTKFHTNFHYFPVVFLIRNQISFLINLFHCFFCGSI